MEHTRKRLSAAYKLIYTLYTIKSQKFWAKRKDNHYDYPSPHIIYHCPTEGYVVYKPYPAVSKLPHCPFDSCNYTTTSSVCKKFWAKTI